MVSESDVINIRNEIQLDDFHSKSDLSNTINCFKCSLKEKYKKKYIIEILKNIEQYTDWYFSNITGKYLILSIENLNEYEIYLESVRKYKKNTTSYKMVSLHKLDKFIFNLNKPNCNEKHSNHSRKTRSHYNYLTKLYIML